jgi:steroid 5-alpha reductase family enzyme
MLSLAFYLLSLIIALSYTTVLFFVAQFKKDNSIIDIGYGLGFIFTAITLMIAAHNRGSISDYTIVLFTLIIIWGTRLSFRIYKKNRNKPEDFRYASWRIEWMRKGYIYYLSRAYLQIFILQGFIISIVLLPYTLTLTANGNGSTILFGLCLWLFGFFFEALGDKQLDTFIQRKNIHEGHIMKTGLWKYTRHPNYFGESMMWFGIAYIAQTSGISLIVFISPILITYLLLFVSGIPMLEKRWGGDQEWEVYKKKTSAFIPMLPKK